VDLGEVRADVVALHAHSVDGMFRDLDIVAKAAGVNASRLKKSLQTRIRHVTSRVGKRPTPHARTPNVFCVEWLDPIFTTGHWVPELVELAGGRDVLARKSMPSRRVTWAEVAAARPEKLILMCCGFTPERTMSEFSALTRRRGWSKLPAVAAGEVYVADGPNLFNGAGPRLVDALEVLAEIIHPPLFCGASPRAGYRRLTAAEIAEARVESGGEVRSALLRKGTVYDEDVHPRYG
jgi:iron complex transport system substrate-binding protein